MNTSTLTMNWTCGERVLAVGERTLVMGVLNVTPDSFSDGGRFVDPNQAVAHGLRMVEEGADLLDVGGESTRPGARPVSEAEELDRTLPVMRALREHTDIALSIDTRKAVVARRAVEAGADIINDVSAGSADAEMLDVARTTGAGLVLMHMQGEPATMQKDPRYTRAAEEIAEYLRERLRTFVEAGVTVDRIALDPGIGFGKRLDHNLELLAGLSALSALRRPILIGLSRKSFLGALTGRDVGDRLSASLGALAYAIMRGAQVVRVHDVKESCDVVRVLDKLRLKER